MSGFQEKRIPEGRTDGQVMVLYFHGQTNGQTNG